MKTALLIIAQLAASGSDAYFTDRNMYSAHAHESNPLARPFIGTRPGRVAYFSVTTAAKITIPIMLRKRRHGRTADTLAMVGIADTAGGAVYSATH